MGIVMSSLRGYLTFKTDFCLLKRSMSHCSDGGIHPNQILSIRSCPSFYTRLLESIDHSMAKTSLELTKVCRHPTCSECTRFREAGPQSLSWEDEIAIRTLMAPRPVPKSADRGYNISWLQSVDPGNLTPSDSSLLTRQAVLRFSRGEKTTRMDVGACSSIF